MRMRKLRGPHMKKSMPFEQFGRTHTQPVNLRDLDSRFDDGAEVTPDALRDKNLATRKGVPVKVLGQGEISKKLTVHAHGFSATAREKIEAAGGTVELLREPKVKKVRHRKAKPVAAEEPEATDEQPEEAAAEDEAPAEESEEAAE
jgi:ribosomal protein L18E